MYFPTIPKNFSFSIIPAIAVVAKKKQLNVINNLISTKCELSKIVEYVMMAMRFSPKTYDKLMCCRNPNEKSMIEEKKLCKMNKYFGRN